MSQSRLKIFITGSDGFIGQHIKNSLADDYNLLLPSKKKLNLNRINDLKKYLNKNKPDLIIHLASSTKFKKKKIDEKYNQIKNTLNITKNLINSINPECKLTIFFGSIEEYGNIKTPFNEKFKVKPMTYYGKYKFKALKYAKKILTKKKLNYLWLRPSLTYGKKDNRERFLGHIIYSLKKNRSFSIKPGNQYRDFLYIEDLCYILKKFIKNYKRTYNTIINISSENYVKLKNVPAIIQKITNKKVNYNILRLAHSDLELLSSNRKLLKLFPDLIFTDFNTGLRKTLRMEGII